MRASYLLQLVTVFIKSVIDWILIYVQSSGGLRGALLHCYPVEVILYECTWSVYLRLFSRQVKIMV
jgi:hypothetical protein